MASESIAAKFEVPQIAVLEYDLATQISMSINQVSNPFRKASRTLKASLNYFMSGDTLRGYAGVHCNGYPVFDAMEPYSANRLLYLDSRMYRDMVIPEADLAHRLRNGVQPLKLLFSGRYEAVKGALDCVRVAIACIERGVDIVLHCYGQGSQQGAMQELVSRSDVHGKVFIHNAVTYPELVKISRSFDIFVCCHVQSDPSCTYLESMGSGLPIVGYANKMWGRLSRESNAGLCSPLNRPELVAEHVKQLASDPQMRRARSTQAREFALAHAFEQEFKLRTDDINRMMM